MKGVQDQEYKFVGLRLVVLLIAAFIVFRILIVGDPVHLGRGGPVMPHRVGIVYITLFTVYWLKGFWVPTIGDLREFFSDVFHCEHLQTLDDLLDEQKNSN